MQNGIGYKFKKLYSKWICHCVFAIGQTLINIDFRPPNSTDINAVDFYVWESMLEKFSHLSLQPKTKVSAYKDMEWFITRHNQEVDHEC